MPSLDPKLMEKMATAAKQVEKAMEQLMPQTDMAEARLYEAMRYGVLSGGKRLRPFLVLSSAKLFGVSEDCALRVAAAVEFVHCYSLIHDDLPAMDNSDMRRGLPTVHKKFNDATAILAGDALLAYAFEIIADADTHEDPKVRVNLLQLLARAAGPSGLCGGQMLDLLAENTTFDIGTITRLQRMKTGELIAFAAQAGAILGRAAPPQQNALRAYAHDVGLAFQIVDDLLDAEGAQQDVGKPTQQDAARGKATFLTVLGSERARAQANILIEQAIRHLKIFEGRAGDLEHVARFVVNRTN